MKPAIVLGLLLTAVALHAQNFSIDWFTIDGGGGTSTGATYSVSGTIGQPDAGRMTGGNFALEGGFWSGISVMQTPGAPTLFVTNGPGGVVIYWPLPATGFFLDASSTLTGSPSIPWAQVPFPYQTNATHIYITVPAPSGARFYRLRVP
jgi:hypothetical protein